MLKEANMIARKCTCLFHKVPERVDFSPPCRAGCWAQSYLSLRLALSLTLVSKTSLRRLWVHLIVASPAWESPLDFKTSWHTSHFPSCFARWPPSKLDMLHLNNPVISRQAYLSLATDLKVPALYVSENPSCVYRNEHPLP